MATQTSQNPFIEPTISINLLLSMLQRFWKAFLEAMAQMADTHPTPYFPTSSQDATVPQDIKMKKMPLTKNSSMLFQPAPPKPEVVAKQVRETGIDAAAKNPTFAAFSAFLMVVGNALLEGFRVYGRTHPYCAMNYMMH